jgi:hypothetical protein
LYRKGENPVREDRTTCFAQRNVDIVDNAALVGCRDAIDELTQLRERTVDPDVAGQLRALGQLGFLRPD